MTQQFLPRRRRKKHGALIWFIFIVVLAITCVVGYMKLIPSFEKSGVVYEVEHPVYYNGVLQEHGALIQEGHVKLPLPLLDQLLDNSPIYYEQESNMLVLTTLDKVLRFKTESLNALLNEKSYELNIAAQVEDGIVYIPAEIIEQLYGLHIEQLNGKTATDNAETFYNQSVAIYDPQFTIETAVVSREKGTALRTEPTIKSPYYMNLSLI